VSERERLGIIPDTLHVLGLYSVGTQANFVFESFIVLSISVRTVAYPGIFSGRGGYTRNFFGGGSVEDRGQREWGSGGGSPLVRGSTQFANE
jgi:hypothetical protein